MYEAEIQELATVWQKPIEIVREKFLRMVELHPGMSSGELVALAKRNITKGREHWEFTTADQLNNEITRLKEQVNHWIDRELHQRNRAQTEAGLRFGYYGEG